MKNRLNHSAPNLCAPRPSSKTRPIAAAACLLIFAGPSAFGGWNLSWSDEFSGTSLNTNDWNYETGAHGTHYYTSRTQNVNVTGGALNLITLRESYGGCPYTSGCVDTKGRHSIQYGKIEISGKLPYSKGLWPAFWMLGINIDTAGWPQCGEIDILELIGGGVGFDDKIYGTGHWYNNGNQSSGGNYQLSSGKFADAYHDFWVEWDPGTIRWFVDGINYFTLDISDHTAMGAFHQPFWVKLNTAIGGEWPHSVGKDPDATTVLPQTFYIDYMRMYAWDGNWETENLPVLGTSGDNHRIISDTSFHNDLGTMLDADAVNDYVIYKVANIAAGTYDVRVGVKKYTTRGIVQMAGARADTMSFSNIGTPQDLYATGAVLTELDFGTWTPGTTSDKAIKFTVTGKNAASSGYSLCFDYIKFVRQ